MKFTQAAPTEGYFQRWVSENGVWEHGLRRMIFGVRVSANPVGADCVVMDYCAGANLLDVVDLLGLTRTILEAQPESLTTRELRAMLPGWDRRPVVRDEACMAGLRQLAEAARQHSDVEDVA